jgi:hypothetical protein
MLNRLVTLIVVRATSRRHALTSSAAEVGAVPGSGSSGPMLPRWPRAARAWMRRNMFLSATFDYRHLQSLRPGTLPTPVQSRLVALFVVLNVITTAVGHSVYTDNLVSATFSSVDIPTFHYLARTPKTCASLSRKFMLPLPFLHLRPST